MHRAVFVVLLLLHLLLPQAINAFALTYPIKGAFMGWEGLHPSLESGPHIVEAADAGYNMFIISFWANTSYEVVSFWFASNPQYKQYYIDYAHSKGMALILGVWITTAYGNLGDVDNTTALGIQIANLVKSNNLDGVDFKITSSSDPDPGFIVGSRDSATSIDWVVNLTIATRQALGPNAIITHSPHAGYFGPIGNPPGKPGSLGGYTAILKKIDKLVQHVNIIFFAEGSTCYVDYMSLFILTASACPISTTVQEISKMANFSISRLVVIKPMQVYQEGPSGSGFLSAKALQQIFSSATNNLNWNGGVVGWTWNNTGNISTGWISDIYPAVPPTEQPSKVPTSNPIISPGKRKSKTLLIIAIVVPVVVVLAILAVVGYHFAKKRQIPQGKLQRLNSLNMSQDLENSYLATNLVTEFSSVVMKDRLGRGGSGVVYKGVWRHTEVAVKEFTNQDIQTTDFIRESEIHAKLRHPNVVQLLAICLPPHMCTISEFMDKGSLADVLESKNPQFTWKRKLQSLHDIAKGMDYLQKSKIIHRDLKSQNVLIDKNWNSKIADFGTSKLVSDQVSTATAYVPRTAQWSAPEVIMNGKYSEKSDVYSYGVVMWECLTGQVPYDGMFAFQVEDRTVKGSRLTVPPNCDMWFQALMTECWAGEPEARPTFEIINAEVEKSLAEIRTTIKN